MLVYLTSLTWTSGETSAAFAREVQEANHKDIHLLLAHEMDGIGQSERHGCKFVSMFACDHGTTPQETKRLGQGSG